MAVATVSAIVLSATKISYAGITPPPWDPKKPVTSEPQPTVTAPPYEYDACDDSLCFLWWCFGWSFCPAQ